MIKAGVLMAIALLGVLFMQGEVYAAENEDTLIVDEIFETISLDEVDDILNEMKEEEIHFSVKDYVKDVLRGKTELSLGSIEQTFKDYAAAQFEKNRNTFFRLVLYGILSGVFLNFSTSMYEKQMGETGFNIVYFLTITIMVGGFVSVFEVAGDVLGNIVAFMKALVPSFSIALTWSSGSVTSMAFYQAALAAIAIAENILVKIFLPIIQVYFLASILNPLTEWKFTKFTSLLNGFIRIGTKTLLAVMIGHQGIQGLIMPALDGVKRSTVFKAANSIPGVGNLFGGVTDTVIGTGVLIKSAIGVGGLIAIIVICVIPIIKIGVFSLMYRGLAAFSQPVTDKRLVSVFHSTAESGKLLLYIVMMTAVMFLISLTIIIAATNRMP